MLGWAGLLKFRGSVSPVDAVLPSFPTELVTSDAVTTQMVANDNSTAEMTATDKVTTTLVATDDIK